MFLPARVYRVEGNGFFNLAKDLDADRVEPPLIGFLHGLRQVGAQLFIRHFGAVFFRYGEAEKKRAAELDLHPIPVPLFGMALRVGVGDEHVIDEIFNHLLDQLVCAFALE